MLYIHLAQHPEMRFTCSAVLSLLCSGLRPSFLALAGSSRNSCATSPSSSFSILWWNHSSPCNRFESSQVKLFKGNSQGTQGTGMVHLHAASLLPCRVFF